MKISERPDIKKPLDMHTFLREHAGGQEQGKLTFETRGGFLSIENRQESQPKHVFILLSGSSESGKSHLGDAAFKAGCANRIKIYKLIANTKEYKKWSLSEGVVNPNPFDFCKIIDSDMSVMDSVFDQVFRDVGDIEDQTDCTVTFFETIKHPWIINKFRNLPDSMVVSTFIDASFEERVKREHQKTGKSIEELEIATKKKDEEKTSFGNEMVRDEADIIINNNGTLEDYERFINCFMSFILNNSNNENSVPIDNTKIDQGELFPGNIEAVDVEGFMRHKFGCMLFKPDAISTGSEDFFMNLVINRMMQKGIILKGVTILDSLSREQVGNLYPDLGEDYFNAYSRIYTTNKMILLVFESRTGTSDVWKDLLLSRGVIGDDKHGLRSIRSFIPLPGRDTKFKEIGDRIKSKSLQSEDYDFLAENLAHVPESLPEFCGIINLIDDKLGADIFGRDRFAELKSVSSRFLIKR